jgi:hypothetical protein
MLCDIAEQNQHMIVKSNWLLRGVLPPIPASDESPNPSPPQVQWNQFELNCYKIQRV